LFRWLPFDDIYVPVLLKPMVSFMQYGTVGAHGVHLHH
jgi:hypothetical protein